MFMPLYIIITHLFFYNANYFTHTIAYNIISPDVKGQKKCIIVQINDKSMKIGVQDNFGTLISNQTRPTLDFAHKGSNMQSKMADIENVYFSYNLK